jgi:hypothetical protein
VIYANAVSAASQIAPHVRLWGVESEPAVASYATHTVFSSNAQFYLTFSLYPADTFHGWPSTATRLEEAKTARHLLEEFAALKDNWDGYNASAISAEARANARRFVDMIEASLSPLPAPEISPLPSGTISFEWEAPGAHTYVEIGTTLYSGFIKTDQGPIFFEGSTDHLDQSVVSLIQRYISVPTPSVAPITEFHARAPQYDLMAL